jgi:hypothetical protein
MHMQTNLTAMTQSAESTTQHQNTKSLENAARRALAAQVGKNLTDEEWERFRARLLEFAVIVRTWERRARAKPSRADNVVMMEREPAREHESERAA